MTPRAQTILARFPAHLEAARPGKLLGEVVDALAIDLDVLSARMAAVRRAHRLAEADELTDLLLIAARHGIRPGELDIVFERFAKVSTLASALSTAVTPAAREAAAEDLLDLWGLSLPHPRLPLFAPPGAPADLAAAATRLLAAAAQATRQAALLDALRQRIGRLCALHAAGNGTVASVINAAANALDLQIGPIVHSADRYWHAAPAADALTISPGVADPLPPAQEFIGLEENPLWRMVTDSIDRHHAERWSLLRRGFERSLLQVRIRAADAGRTIGPMLVNRDEGHGVGFVGPVPAGQTLVFTEEGRALLDGADATSFAYAWQGACFAGTDLDAKRDFAFDGPALAAEQRPARFVTTVPAGALDREAVFPHAGQSLPMPGIAVGSTRLAYFAQQAHFGSREATAVRSVTPRSRAALFDASVWAAGLGQTEAVAGEVSLSWMERRAFAARLLIPGRFRHWREATDADASQVLRRVSRALQRFRPAGVALTVEFIDERWVLGQGVLPGGAVPDPITALRSATALWDPPEAPVA
jgi:hypothetical protein